MVVISTYVDRAVSARTDNRPEFQKMITDSAQKQFDVVLVWKLDRFARNRADSAMYRAILKRNGVKVVSAKENISEGPEGIILESLLEGISEYYSAEPFTLALSIVYLPYRLTQFFVQPLPRYCL